METGDYANLASATQLLPDGSTDAHQPPDFAKFNPLKQRLLYGSPILTMRKFCIWSTQFIYLQIFLKNIKKKINYFPIQYKPSGLLMEI
jgi:hypothetical protein